MYKLLVFIELLAAVALTFTLHGFIKEKIDPRKSTVNFVLYFVLHLAVIFLLVFGISFLIFQTGRLMVKK